LVRENLRLRGQGGPGPNAAVLSPSPQEREHPESTAPLQADRIGNRVVLAGALSVIIGE